MLIKIYPEWNVNKKEEKQQEQDKPIKIYPEWNVNYGYSAVQNSVLSLKSTQSGM